MVKISKGETPLRMLIGDHSAPISGIFALSGLAGVPAGFVLCKPGGRA
jgi:hypothetical protein